MKIFLTGGTGYIGLKLAQKLIFHGHLVVVPTRRVPDATEQLSGVVYVQADISNPLEDLIGVIRGCSLIFHCAGEVKDEARMRALHVDGFQNLLNACGEIVQNEGARLHWVQLSSVGAYGPPIIPSLPRVVTENTALEPVGEYEKTKAESDVRLIANSLGDQFTYTILRPSNVCGQSMPNKSLRQLAAMVKRGLFFYIGNRGAISTYVHLDDVVDALIECGFNPLARGHVFNLSNDCDQEDFVNGLATMQGVRAPRFRLPEWIARTLAFLGSPFKEFPLKMSRVDAMLSRTRYPADKLSLILGFKPRVDMMTMIRDVLKS